VGGGGGDDEKVRRLRRAPLCAGEREQLAVARADGGLGLGTTATSVVFLVTILAVVAFLTVTRRDVTLRQGVPPEPGGDGERRAVPESS
jgi:hypothetical protein